MELKKQIDWLIYLFGEFNSTSKVFLRTQMSKNLK